MCQHRRVPGIPHKNRIIMETITPIIVNNPVPLYTSTEPLQPVGQVAQVSSGQFTQTGTMITTLTIASALSIGSNMVDVKTRRITVPLAILNAAAKGVAATVILNSTARTTPFQVVMVAGILAGTGFLIDTVMKKDKSKKTSDDLLEVSA